VSNWRVVILAAGRGGDDPMAKAFGVAHKCTIAIAGKPMLQWVLEALRGTRIASPYVIVIDNAEAASIASSDATDIKILAAANSAPASALAAIREINQYPVLITTGDHPLLTPAMIDAMVKASELSNADVLVGLATRATIHAAYPETKRTYFNLGDVKVSGCNLFVVKTEAGLKLLQRWQHLEQNRKKPWKLVAAFGIKPILLYAAGLMTAKRAFDFVSQSLGIEVEPVYLPYAEAAIDVDKPSDHVLAEMILRMRQITDHAQ
jgi:GTP:adenosylcobinamide-phosphate guanylyltransferase